MDNFSNITPDNYHAASCISIGYLQPNRKNI
jgi:hypothetical protein